MILEGIVTTTNQDGTTNVSPMGPIVDREVTSLRLRPFQSSQTFRNLKRTGGGVFHVTDDVELLAQCAVGSPEPMPDLISVCDNDERRRLADTCRWYAFQVETLDESQPRSTIDCQIDASGRVRDFWGFNRAKHACVEAAILATRVGIVPDAEIRSQFLALQVLVEKTAGSQEQQAFAFLRDTVERKMSVGNRHGS